MSSQSCWRVLTTMFSLVVMCGMLDYGMLFPTFFSKQENVVPLTLKDSLRKMLTGTWQMLKWNNVTSWDENISAVHAYRPTNSRTTLPFIKMQDWYEKKVQLPTQRQPVNLALIPSGNRSRTVRNEVRQIYELHALRNVSSTKHFKKKKDDDSNSNTYVTTKLILINLLRIT